MVNYLTGYKYFLNQNKNKFLKTSRFSICVTMAYYERLLYSLILNCLISKTIRSVGFEAKKKKIRVDKTKGKAKREKLIFHNNVNIIYSQSSPFPPSLPPPSLPTTPLPHLLAGTISLFLFDAFFFRPFKAPMCPFVYVS